MGLDLEANASSPADIYFKREAATHSSRANCGLKGAIFIRKQVCREGGRKVIFPQPFSLSLNWVLCDCHWVKKN